MFAAVLSAVLLGVAYWWFRADWLLTAVYAGVALVATLSVPLMYRLAGFTLADEIEWLESREAEDHKILVNRLSELRTQLEQLGIDEGVKQTDTLTNILNDYHNVVETRFLGKKHSPIAYLSAARRVQKHAVQNLTDAVAVGHSLASISRHDIHDNPLERMQELGSGQSERLRSLLDENRNLFGALTDTAVEVANIRSYSDYERLDTLARLVSLAEIANKTGK